MFFRPVKRKLFDDAGRTNTTMQDQSPTANDTVDKPTVATVTIEDKSDPGDDWGFEGEENLPGGEMDVDTAINKETPEGMSLFDNPLADSTTTSGKISSKPTQAQKGKGVANEPENLSTGAGAKRKIGQTNLSPNPTMKIRDLEGTRNTEAIRGGGGRRGRGRGRGRNSVGSGNISARGSAGGGANLPVSAGHHLRSGNTNSKSKASSVTSPKGLHDAVGKSPALPPNKGSILPLSNATLMKNPLYGNPLLTSVNNVEEGIGLDSAGLVTQQVSGFRIPTQDGGASNNPNSEVAEVARQPSQQQ